MSRQRPTQRDIAKAADVNQATVSLALRNHPRISESLRERIHRIANSLEYRPDPFLSGLSAYKRTIQHTSYQATLAWVTNYSPKDRLEKNNVVQNYFDGAVARANEMGYRIEEHSLSDPEMSPRRLENILRAKNIPGVLLAPQQYYDTCLDLTLKHASVVSFGYSLKSPSFHTVTNHHFRSMEIVLHQLFAYGYERPALVAETDDEKRNKSIPSSCFLNVQSQLPRKQRVPVLIEEELSARRFFQWYDRYRPDVIISLWEKVYPWLIQKGIGVPEEVGLALLSTRESNGIFAGVHERQSLVGARAVEFLIDLIHRGERGIPKIPSHMMIEGAWKDGKTVRSPTRPTLLA